MSYVTRQLNTSETVVLESRLHWIVFAWPTAILVLFSPVLFGGGVGDTVAGASFLWVLVVAGYAYAFAAYISAEFAVTSQRVILKTGLLNRRTVELQLAKIEALSIQQSIVGGLFGYGELIIAGTGGTKERFRFIRSIDQFRRAVQEQTQAVGPVARAERECPFCAERILAKATMCRFCGKPVAPLSG